jgi:hypothetical protein
MTEERSREDVLETAARIANDIHQLLVGQGPDVQGAALGEAVALFIAGHHPALRPAARRMLEELIADLVPICIEEMIARGKVPPEMADIWRNGTR